MDYLSFVEEQKPSEEGLTLFEKVLVASARAKDLLEERKTPIKSLRQHKPISIAIYELNREMLEPVIQEKSDAGLYFQDDSEEEEE